MGGGELCERARRLERAIDTLRRQYEREGELVAATEHAARLEELLIALERCADGGAKTWLRELAAEAQSIRAGIGGLLGESTQNAGLVAAAEEASRLVGALRRVNLQSNALPDENRRTVRDERGTGE